MSIRNIFSGMTNYTQEIISKVKLMNPTESEFVQSVDEVLSSLSEFLESNPQYEKHKILERLVEPERIISFKVVWVNDANQIQINRGYRVQFSSAIGPYKGGLRFHPSVNLSILKFLGFEQTFKNSLTGLPIGGGKGGSDFDPKGKSDSEIMRFCQAFMNELYRHIGPLTDVPAGDIGVGGTEIGYLFGQYKKITNTFSGALTGKGAGWGGSFLRPEATGYGLVYFAQEMLKTKNDSLKDKLVIISGSGNVAQYTAKKSIELGAKVLTMSDSDGYIFDSVGIDSAKLEFIMDLKNNKKGRISEYAAKYNAEFVAGKNPWGVKADVAFPCATQNEISKIDSEKKKKNGIILVGEGANKPSTAEAINVFHENKILFAPAKASNAGGVAVSTLEMAQNSGHTEWTAEKVDSELKSIMQNIHSKAVLYGKSKNSDYVDYLKGANIAGFKRVADAMLSQGL